MKKPIMIVSEYLTMQEGEEGATSSPLLQSLLRQANINPSDCHFTQVIARPLNFQRLESYYVNKSEGISGYRAVTQSKYFPASQAHELNRLQAEIDAVEPNVIVALGNLSLWALCKKSGIKRYRGSPLLTFDGKRKVIPSWPMSSVIRQWELRVICLADLTKARNESTFPDLIRPSREIWIKPEIEDIERFYEKYIVPSPFLGCDIETKSKTITEVGYSTADGRHAIVIPFYSRLAEDGNYWPSFTDERRAWKWVRKINEEKPLVGQNFAYDMTYFWKTVGIPCPQFLGDTMLLHHALQPEMEKGLGFLGSVYTSEPSWKFMRQSHDTLKRGDD